MIIAGFSPNSFVDFPQKIAFIVFTQGCNMNCFYCHNRQLINKNPSIIYPVEMILKKIEERRNFIDGVVVSGGEPTLHKGLEDFLNRVRSLNLLTKLDTNGLRPDIIKDLLDKKLLDYIAMDIKAPFSKLFEICGVAAESDKIRESIDLIINSGIDYEFRTTVVPQLGMDDIKEMAGYIKEAKKYTLQDYRPPQYEGYKNPKLILSPHRPQLLDEMRALFEKK